MEFMTRWNAMVRRLALCALRRKPSTTSAAACRRRTYNAARKRRTLIWMHLQAPAAACPYRRAQHAAMHCASSASTSC